MAVSLLAFVSKYLPFGVIETKGFGCATGVEEQICFHSERDQMRSRARGPPKNPGPSQASTSPLPPLHHNHPHPLTHLHHGVNTQFDPPNGLPSPPTLPISLPQCPEQQQTLPTLLLHLPNPPRKTRAKEEDRRPAHNPNKIPPPTSRDPATIKVLPHARTAPLDDPSRVAAFQEEEARGGGVGTAEDVSEYA